ncbi:MAG TPA: hypothetical protein V6C89_02550 [Drouetiella sp.]
MNMTGQNVARFEYGSKEPSEVEKEFQRSLESAESTFGPLSGEVGLILSAMVEHYRNNPEKAADVAAWEKRVEEIVQLYILDQRSP